MFGTKKNREENRFYLLPGMGKSNRRHRQLVLRWAIVVGLVVSAILGYVLYYFSKPHL